MLIFLLHQQYQIPIGVWDLPLDQFMPAQFFFLIRRTDYKTVGIFQQLISGLPRLHNNMKIHFPAKLLYFRRRVILIQPFIRDTRILGILFKIHRFPPGQRMIFRHDHI